MGYLICQECGGYYKLEKGESSEDFVSCECYGSLTYVEDLDDYSNENNKLDEDHSQDIKDKSHDTQDTSIETKFNEFKTDSEIDLDGEHDELSHNKQKPESFSYPSFKGSDSQMIKDRNYYRKINSKDRKPDIVQLKLIKDVNGIIEALNYHDPEVKLEAVKALGSIGDGRALKPLDKVKKEENGILKTFAENAIFHIQSKKRGLKSQNRAYYRKEYYKDASSKLEENKPINQSVTKIKDEKTFNPPKKSEKVPNKNGLTTVETNVIGTDKESNASTFTVQSPPQSENHSGTKTQLEHNKSRNRDLQRNTQSDHKKNVTNKTVKESNSIYKVKNKSSTGFETQETVSKPNTRNSLNRPTNFPENKSVNNAQNPEKTTHNQFIEHSNPAQFNAQSEALFVSPTVVKRDIANKPAHSGEIKGVSGTEVMESDLYFIQFLGIKNADKPLIGFIFLFAASLVVGVLLTMGYQ